MPQGSLGAVWKKRKSSPVYLQRFYNTMHVCAKWLQSCPTLCDPRTVARQAPLSMRFSRQEYWSGLLCSPPGDLPSPGSKPCILHLLDWQAGFSPLASPWKPLKHCSTGQNQDPDMQHLDSALFDCLGNTMPLPPWNPLGIDPDGPSQAL